MLRVEITPRADGFTGRLAVDDASTRGTVRELEGATCTEVIEALGLVVEVAVDPRASLLPVRESAPPPQDAASETPAEHAGLPSSRDTAVEPPRRPKRRFAAGVQAEAAAVAGVVFSSGAVFGEIELGKR